MIKTLFRDSSISFYLPESKNTTYDFLSHTQYNRALETKLHVAELDSGRKNTMKEVYPYKIPSQPILLFSDNHNCKNEYENKIKKIHNILQKKFDNLNHELYELDKLYELNNKIKNKPKIILNINNSIIKSRYPDNRNNEFYTTYNIDYTIHKIDLKFSDSPQKFLNKKMQNVN